MRSAVLLGLVVLAGCKPAEQAPAEPSASAAESIDLIGSPSDPPAPPPTVPGDLSKPSPSASNAPKVKLSDLPPPPDGIPQFQALGTEPFWSFKSSPGRLNYSSPEVPEGAEFMVNAAWSGKVTRYTGTLQGKPMVLTIEPGTCSDGMSDTVYAYKATFKWGDRTEQGCARLK
jgi:uncharacterized membrane protein